MAPQSSYSTQVPSELSLKPLEAELPQASENDEAEFEVQKIVDERLTDDKVIVYKIRWKGYSKEDDTWEPIDNLNGCDDLLDKWRIKKAKKQQERQKKIIERVHQQNRLEGHESDGSNKRQKRSSSPSYGSSSSKTARLTPPNGFSERSSSSINSQKLQFVGVDSRQKDSQDDHQIKKSVPLDDEGARKRKEFERKLKKLRGPPVTLVNEVDDDPCPPLSFTFIEKHIIGDGVPGPDVRAMWGCSCNGAYGCAITRPEECECTELCDEENRKFAYRHGGKLRLVDNSQFAIHECNEMCTCNWRCPNKVTFNGRKLPIEIFKTKSKGWGLRCPEAIPAGTFIDKYVGEVITPEEADRRVALNNDRGLSYLFDLDKFKGELEESAPIYTVDGADFGGVTRFINHSCDPNLLIYAVTRNRSSLAVYDIALFSRKDIKPYEELTFQYTHNDEENSEAAEQLEQKWPCYCGAETCKGYLW